MLGAGVYWSDDVTKARAYGDTVLKLQVRAGRVKKIDEQGHALQKSWHVSHGYDTAWVPPRCGMVDSGLSENCTYDPKRLTVTHVSYDKGASWRPVGARSADVFEGEEDLRRQYGVSSASVQRQYADFAHVPTRAQVLGL